MKNAINNGMTFLDSMPEFAEVGDVHYNSSNGMILIFDGRQWIPVQSNADKRKAIDREESIDELLDNTEFDPEYFGFEDKCDSYDFRYTFEYDSNTYEIIKDKIHSNFFLVRSISESFNTLVYYRGKIPTNRFAQNYSKI